MKRKLIDELLVWKDSKDNKPILLSGARGVGKSFITMDFAKSFYREYVYINFENEPFHKDLFNSKDCFLIENKLKEQFHLTESKEPVLMILDEVSNVSDILEIINLISQIKAFQIILISSVLTDTIKNNDLFVHLHLFPLDFEEFLDATGNEWYIEVIKTHFNLNKKVPDIVHLELISLFEEYVQVGGMPLALNEYINTEGIYNISEQHKLLMNSYLSDINNDKYDSLKINQVLSTIDDQLMKDNHKFQFNLIRKGSTQALYSDALEYIHNSFYGLQCNKVGDEALNLSENYETSGLSKKIITCMPHFKLYMQDVGMLCSILKKNQDFNTKSINMLQINKALVENYVAQSLTAKGYTLYFWESNSQAKIDFLIIKDNKFIPIEVRATEHTRSKNISVFKTKCSNMNESIKISTKNFEYLSNTKYVPVYAVFCI